MNLAAQDTAEERPPFGTLLRQYRTAAGLTQGDLADRANLSVRGISDLERSARKAPHPQTIRQLGTALGLTDDECAVLATAGRRAEPSRVADDTSTTVSKTHAKRMRVLSLLACAAAVGGVMLGVGALLVPRAIPPVAASSLTTRVPTAAVDGPMFLSDSFAEPASGLFHASRLAAARPPSATAARAHISGTSAMRTMRS